MDDRHIVNLYLQRSEDAIQATEEKYGAYCYHIAYNILTDAEDAREAVNDAYLGAWNAIPPHRPSSLAAFLGKITRRIAINRYHAKRTRKRGGGETALALEELSQCIPAGQDPEAALAEKELAALLNRFVRSLPETERKVFTCRYWYLDSVKEIAKRFGFSESKVKSMLFRTRNKLKAELEKEGIVI